MFSFPSPHQRGRFGANSAPGCRSVRSPAQQPALCTRHTLTMRWCLPVPAQTISESFNKHPPRAAPPSVTSSQVRSSFAAGDGKAGNPTLKPNSLQLSGVETTQHLPAVTPDQMGETSLFTCSCSRKGWAAQTTLGSTVSGCHPKMHPKRCGFATPSASGTRHRKGGRVATLTTRRRGRRSR